MATLTRDEVLKLAMLARLKLSDDEVAEYQRELAAILDYVQQLDAVDTGTARPTTQVTGLTNISRADEVIDYGYAPRDLLKNVPQTDDDQLKVRRMIN